MRYMLLIYGPDPATRPDDSAAMRDMQPWFDYGNWLTERGLFRAGEPLAPTSSATTVRVQGGQRLVTDGPFAETKEVLGGYYVIECDDLDTAIDAAARCPGARFGSMEVRPIAEMPAQTPA
jgi:hypothetical protein